MEWIFNLKPQEQWAVGLGAVLITTLLAQWFGQRLNHRLVLWREQKAALRQAVDQFQSAFSPELAILEDKIMRNIDVRDVLLSAYNRHYVAVIQFRNFVQKRKIHRLNNAWQEHCYGKILDPFKWGFTGKDALFLHYFSVNSKNEARTLAIKSIHKILLCSCKT